MAILKDAPHRVHFPQDLLKPKLVSYNMKGTTVSINLNIPLLCLHSPEEVTFLHFDLKCTAHVYTAGVQKDADTQRCHLLHFAVPYLNCYMKESSA